MSPQKSIIVFLLAGLDRIPESARIEVLLSTFAGVLPDLTLEDIADVREQVIARLWTTPAVADALIDLIDGHVALRALNEPS